MNTEILVVVRLEDLLFPWFMIVWSKGMDMSVTANDRNFDAILNRPRQRLENSRLVHLDEMATPLGPMFLGATETGLCLLEFAEPERLEREVSDLENRLHAQVVRGKNQHTLQAADELTEYFSDTRLRQKFTVSLDPVGTEFQKKVWQVLRDIPYGDTCSYLQQAQCLGNPKAVRAVANANGMNKIAIVIPCHRVIGSDGSLTGYGGGLPRKQWLLAHEQKRLS